MLEPLTQSVISTPSVQITTWTTAAFTFCIFSPSSLFSCYFLRFLCSFFLILLSLGICHYTPSSSFGTDVHYASLLVILIHVCHACWHLAPSCSVLDCLNDLVVACSCAAMKLTTVALEGRQWELRTTDCNRGCTGIPTSSRWWINICQCH